MANSIEKFHLKSSEQDVLFVRLPTEQATVLCVVCQICHSAEVVFKAGVRTNISEALSSGQRSLCDLMIMEKRETMLSLLLHPIWVKRSTVYVLFGK